MATVDIESILKEERMFEPPWSSARRRPSKPFRNTSASISEPRGMTLAVAHNGHEMEGGGSRRSCPGCGVSLHNGSSGQSSPLGINPPQGVQVSVSSPLIRLERIALSERLSSRPFRAASPPT